MALGQIFREITGRDYREFDGNTSAILACVQNDYAEKMRKIIRGKDYDNPIRFFSKDGSGGGFRDKLDIETTTIDEIFQEQLNSL